MSRYGPIMLPQYFEQQDEHDLCVAMTEYYHHYHHPPKDADDIVDMLGDDARTIVHSIFLGYAEWDLSYAKDMTIQFAQEQAAKIAVLESMEDISNGNLDKVLDKIRKASKVGQDIGDLGLIVQDVDSWLHDAMVDKVPTGLYHLDAAMGGGLAAGELGVFLSPPNYGKSMALLNVGYGAAGPITRLKVAHFTLEMDAKVVAKRYGARMVFRFPTKNDAEYRQDFLNMAEMMMPGEVRAIRIRGSVNVLRAKLESLADDGFEPGLIIVDYGDLVAPTIPRSDKYTELEDIFVGLRELGSPEEFNCPVWTATQTNRTALNKKVITMADLADSFKKAAVSDAIVAICQTREEEQSDQCRLYLAKLRDGKARSMIMAKYYTDQQALISTGFVNSPVEE